jgi:phage terminase small subunit
MPVLDNARHERFAQELALGKTADEAYVLAGFKANRGNATTLKAKQSIQERVAEILQRGAERAEITEEMVLRELAKIGFADIRKAIKWNGHLVRTEDNPDGGEVLLITSVVNNHVTLIDSDELDDETAAAIAKISQNATGGITLQMHDKQAALVNIGKHLGMFIERSENINHNIDVTDEPASEDEWAGQHARPN